ncbi:MAG: tetratricopeptide repeat protein [Bacillota bacterium]|nr:tetratricopeptide repeat protein [Bacillota bacterium]
MWPFRRPSQPALSQEQLEIQRAIRRQHFDKAESLLQSMLEKEPRDAWALNKTAVVWILTGRIQAAQTLLEDLLAQNPDYAPAWVNRGNLAFERDNLEEAQLCYEKALELDPHSSAAHNNLAAIHKRKGDIQAMVRHLKESNRARIRHES